MTTEYVRFQWFDFEKFNSDAIGALNDLGLGSLGYVIALFSTDII